MKFEKYDPQILRDIEVWQKDLWWKEDLNRIADAIEAHLRGKEEASHDTNKS